MKIPTFKILVFLLAIVSFQSASAQETNKLDANGKKDGIWKGIHEESKRPRYEGTFEHGIEVGTFQFFDDTKAGSVIATRVFSENGTVAYNTFYDQKKFVVSEGKAVNRLNEGEWKYYHKESKAIMTIENYSKGKLTGIRKVFYKSGKIAEETTYKDGIKNGMYKSYAENGNVMELSNFKNGEYDGIATFKDTDGKLISKGPFVNGQKKGLWEFYSEGKLKEKKMLPIVKNIGKRKIKQT